MQDNALSVRPGLLQMVTKENEQNVLNHSVDAEGKRGNKHYFSSEGFKVP